MPGAHILVIPYQAPGHMLPILDLTHQLAIRGLTITILVTPKNLTILHPLLSTHPSIQTLILPLPPHPSIPAGVENMQELPIDIVHDLMTAMCGFYKPVLFWFRTQTSPPVAIISDICHSLWTQSLARHLRIRRIGFGPVNSRPLSTWWLGLCSPEVDDLPEALIQNSDDLPEALIQNSFANVESWGTIVNSFTELESESLDYFKRKIHPRIWPVGPLLPIKSGQMGLTERGGPNSTSGSQVLAWLDSCQVDKSVVYVGFGSQITLSQRQIDELATALEESGVKFIWVLKGPMKGILEVDDFGVVPTEFEDRVAGRGFVIRGWAPQVAILEHRAVGAYLTHCGWNSALEGLLAGVLLLAWPMQADHYFNAKLLVDELGVAIQVCEGLGVIPDSVKLARVLAESVSGNRPEKVRGMELRQMALNAIKKGGSSYKALDELVKELSSLNFEGKIENC